MPDTCLVSAACRTPVGSASRSDVERDRPVLPEASLRFDGGRETLTDPPVNPLRIAGPVRQMTYPPSGPGANLGAGLLAGNQGALRRPASDRPPTWEGAIAAFQPAKSLEVRGTINCPALMSERPPAVGCWPLQIPRIACRSGSRPTPPPRTGAKLRPYNLLNRCELRWALPPIDGRPRGQARTCVLSKTADTTTCPQHSSR